jgi:hypothetical protein
VTFDVHGNHDQSKHPKDQCHDSFIKNTPKCSTILNTRQYFCASIYTNRTLKQNLNPSFFSQATKLPSSTTMWKIVAEIEGVAIKEKSSYGFKLGN